jgi:hypothetical protein
MDDYMSTKVGLLEDLRAELVKQDKTTAADKAQRKRVKRYIYLCHQAGIRTEVLAEEAGLSPQRIYTILQEVKPFDDESEPGSDAEQAKFDAFQEQLKAYNEAQTGQAEPT